MARDVRVGHTHYGAADADCGSNFAGVVADRGGDAADFPEADVRLAFWILSAGPAVPYSFAYFICGRRYASSYAILLLMEDMTASRQAVAHSSNHNR